MSITSEPVPLTLAEAHAAWLAEGDRIPPPDPSGSREDTLTRERGNDARASEQAAIERWIAEERGRPAAPSVLVVHRHAWLCRRLERDLHEAGLAVVGALENSAQAVAALVVTQPDVVLLSDRVPGSQGLDLVRRCRELSPATSVIVHVDSEDRMEAAVQAGARAVLSHRQPVQEMVERVVYLACTGATRERPGTTRA